MCNIPWVCIPAKFESQPPTALSHRQIVWSWYMDFSINLGEFITINPSSTELHLAYKTLSNHPATPTPLHLIMSSFLANLSFIHQVSHKLEACILYHVDLSKFQSGLFHLFSLLFIFLNNGCCFNLYHLLVATLGCQEGHSDPFWLPIPI